MPYSTLWSDQMGCDLLLSETSIEKFGYGITWDVNETNHSDEDE